MFAGLSAGFLTDKVRGKYMIVFGPLITLAALVCLSFMDQYTKDAYIGGILFVGGVGIGMCVGYIYYVLCVCLLYMCFMFTIYVYCMYNMSCLLLSIDNTLVVAYIYSIILLYKCIRCMCMDVVILCVWHISISYQFSIVILITNICIVYYNCPCYRYISVPQQRSDHALSTNQSTRCSSCNKYINIKY